MRPILCVLALCILPAASFGQELRPIQIILKSGEVITVPEIHEDSYTVWFKRGDKTAFVSRADIKEIIKPTPCALKPEQSPSLRGFKLGQTFAEVEKRFPRVLRDPIEDSPVHEANIGADLLTGHDEFAGVNGFNLLFLDGLLVSITADYDPLTDWTEGQFRDAVIDGLKLQRAGWADLRGGYKLQCEGFAINTSVRIRANTIQVERDGLSQELKARIDAVRKEVRKVFKP